mgnify:CR=1 FL=1
MNNEHYPIEVIHWAGMTDECLPDLKQLLEKYPDYINTKNGYNDNALIVAARTGNADIVKYLIALLKSLILSFQTISILFIFNFHYPPFIKNNYCNIKLILIY